MSSSHRRPSFHRRTTSLTAIEVSEIHEEIKLLDERIDRVRGQMSAKNPGRVTGSMATMPSPSSIRASEALAQVMAVELCGHAANNNVSALRRLLTDPGVVVDCTDYDGRTPLHVACARGAVDAATLLIESGANVSAIDSDGCTPAQLAQANGHADVEVLFMQSIATMEPESFNTASFFGTPPYQQSRGLLNVVSPRLTRDIAAGEGLILIMVGLPGRGKSYVCNRIKRYMEWNGFECGIFAHAQYRKSFQRNQQRTESSSGDLAQPADLNLETSVAQCIGSDIMSFFGSRQGSVALIDGTNSTYKRRNTLATEIIKCGLVASDHSNLIFVEIQNEDESIIRGHVERAKEMAGDKAPADFVDRYYQNMKDHERVYQPLSDDSEREGKNCFIVIKNERSLTLNKISGVVPSRLAYLLHNLRHSPVPVYLTTAGEWVDLVHKRVGGNSKLTMRGRAYSLALFQYMRSEGHSTIAVHSSTKKAAQQTCYHFMRGHVPREDSISTSQTFSEAAFSPDPSEGTLESDVDFFPTLDDINRGDCDGQTLEAIGESLPNTLSALLKEPFTVAWPNGESLQQVYNSRLEPHIHDIQSSPHPVLVVTHECILQGLLTYFDDEHSNDRPEDALKVDVPMHTVFKLKQRGLGRETERISLESAVGDIIKRWGNTSPMPRTGSSSNFRSIASSDQLFK